MDPANDQTASREVDSPPAQAAEWFARLHSERSSEADCEAFRKWRSSSSENAEAYDAIVSGWEIAGDYADAPAILEMRLSALSQDATDGWWGRYSRIAAVLVLAAMASAVFLVTSLGWPGEGGDRTPSSRIAAAHSEGSEVQTSTGAGESVDVASAQAETQEFQSAYSTRIGEMAEFSLPDGSILALNTESRVRVDYSSQRRDIVLVSGEAMFTVAKDAGRPFTVQAGDNRVVALGTIFTVRKEGRGAKVTLIEGRVRVDRADGAGSSATANLSPGEQLRVLPDLSFSISKAEIGRATSWRSGRLEFDQTPLREVLEEFNRYTSEKHVLRDEQLGDLLVSGSFRIRSSEHFAATLEAGFPVVVRARSGGAVLEVYSVQELEEQAVP